MCPQQWRVGPVEVSKTPYLAGGTALESGQGAGLVPVPQVETGVVQTLFEPVSVIDLIPSAQATTSSVRYMNEGTATSGAAGVAEGGTKPASDIAVSTSDEPVKKVATVLTVSDELLEDAVQVQGYLNSRLSLLIRNNAVPSSGHGYERARRAVRAFGDQHLSRRQRLGRRGAVQGADHHPGIGQPGAVGDRHASRQLRGGQARHHHHG